MSVSLNFLVNILQIELREVENDLKGMEQLYIDRHDSSEITNYVFLENTAVLKSEVDSIHQIGVLLDKIDIDENQTPQELLQSIDAYIKGICEERQFSQAIYNFTKTKILKVSKYLDM